MAQDSTDTPRLQPAAFFTYVRADDEHEDFRISAIREALSAEIAMQLGVRTFLIYQDKEDVLVGQQWKERLENLISSSTFLVAIITPRLFQSAACREELHQFLKNERELGRQDLIVPIYYMTAPQMETPGDDLAQAITERQYVDWRDIRHETRDAAVVRDRLARLAAQVVTTIHEIKLKPEIQLGGDIGGERSDSLADVAVADRGDEGGDPLPFEPPGFIDLVAGLEDAMPLMNRSTRNYADELAQLGEDFERVSDPAKNATARQKLTLLASLAKSLAERGDNMSDAALKLGAEVERVGGGLIAIAEHVFDVDDDEELEALYELAQTLRELKATTSNALDVSTEFRRVIRENMKISAVTRPTLRRIDSAAGDFERAVHRLMEFVDFFLEAVDRRCKLEGA